jgi:S-adenosylmethionine synthetase
MRLVIGDRATMLKEFDIADLAVSTAREWFQQNLPNVDPVNGLIYQVELKRGSDQLAGIFAEDSYCMKANDTSAAVGYAPLTPTEKLVLAAERMLNSQAFKISHPETGHDVKIMAVRKGIELSLTVAMPLLDKFVNNEKHYFELKRRCGAELVAYLRSHDDAQVHIDVNMNTLDTRGGGISGIYLSVSGTSAEDGDSGQVGRGNQANGIISLNRPRGSEAAAGKNPTSHVGKIYSVLSHVLAENIHREVPGLKQVIVWLCSRIGDPVTSPQIAAVQVALEGKRKITEVKPRIREVVSRGLGEMPVFCRALAEGLYTVC